MKKILSLISVLLLISLSGCIMDNSSESDLTPEKRGVDQITEEDPDIIQVCTRIKTGHVVEISGTKESLENAGIDTREHSRCDTSDDGSTYPYRCKKYVDEKLGISWQSMLKSECYWNPDDGTVIYTEYGSGLQY